MRHRRSTPLTTLALFGGGALLAWVLRSGIAWALSCDTFNEQWILELRGIEAVDGGDAEGQATAWAAGGWVAAGSTAYPEFGARIEIDPPWPDVVLRRLEGP